VRSITDPDNRTAEFSLLVRSDQQRQGLGRMLFDKMIDYCRARGTQELIGDVLMQNHRMLRLAEFFGFTQHSCLQDRTVRVRLNLQEGIPIAAPLQREPERVAADVV